MRKLIILFAIGMAFFVAMWIASCTPKQRFDRLVKKHPYVLPKDTIHDTIGIPVYLYVDSSKLKQANEDFYKNIDSAKKHTDDLAKKEPCAELANKAKINIIGAQKAKMRIDTVYKQSECRIEPYFKSDSNVIISAKVAKGNIVVDYTFKQMKYTKPLDREWLSYWQSNLALAFLVLMFGFIVARWRR